MDDYADDMRLKNTLEPQSACDPTSKCDEDCALSVHAQMLCILRVFMFMSSYLLLSGLSHACHQCSCRSSCCICTVS